MVSFSSISPRSRSTTSTRDDKKLHHPKHISWPCLLSNKVNTLGLLVNVKHFRPFSLNSSFELCVTFPQSPFKLPRGKLNWNETFGGCWEPTNEAAVFVWFPQLLLGDILLLVGHVSSSFLAVMAAQRKASERAIKNYLEHFISIFHPQTQERISNSLRFLTLLVLIKFLFIKLRTNIALCSSTSKFLPPLFADELCKLCASWDFGRAKDSQEKRVEDGDATKLTFSSAQHFSLAWALLTLLSSE